VQDPELKHKNHQKKKKKEKKKRLYYCICSLVAGFRRKPKEEGKEFCSNWLLSESRTIL
jgi:hypothetical protein